MSISDWSSDVCSADLLRSSRPCRRNPCIRGRGARPAPRSNPCGYISRAVAFAGGFPHAGEGKVALDAIPVAPCLEEVRIFDRATAIDGQPEGGVIDIPLIVKISRRSEEHTSELQSLMRISYAVFCLKKKKTKS